MESKGFFHKTINWYVLISTFLGFLVDLATISLIIETCLYYFIGMRVYSFKFSS